VAEAYGDAIEVNDADAETVVVPDAGSAPAANAALETAAHITGTVTGPDQQPLPFVTVYAFREYQEEGRTYFDNEFNARTDQFGRYDLGALRGGTYRIRFGDDYYSPNYDEPVDYAYEWYADAAVQSAATDIAVEPRGLKEGIDAQLGADGEIAGKVTDVNGDPIEEAYVAAYVRDGSDWEEVMETETLGDGTYLIDSLQPGTYRVGFVAYLGDNSDYVEEYWSDKGLIENGTDVVVGQDTVGGINAAMVLGEHEGETVPTVTNTALPTISGSAYVGTTLTATTGSWSPDANEFYFDWLRDGQFIDGAYASTYVPTAADLGKKITVLVTAGRLDHEYGHAESAPTAPVTTAPVVTPPVVTPPAPVVDVPAGLAAVLRGVDTSGKPKVGKTVKVTGLDAMFRVSTAVSYKFKWFAGKKAIKKATKSKLKVTRAMKGKVLSVKVTGTAGSTSKWVKLKVGKVK
jgi:protocatechuate 3,4-dioxygenase beta subunit